MKMKKLISILAAGTMTMGLLAGCGSSSESTEEDTSGQAAQEDAGEDRGPVFLEHMQLHVQRNRQQDRDR